MDILFLDIDGVLVCYEPGIKLKYAHNGMHEFKKSCVTALNRFIQESGCDIVISSTWRKFHDIRELREHFQKQGVVGKIIGVTPSLDYGIPDSETHLFGAVERGKEIYSYLLDHPGMDRFVIFDDDSDMWKLKENFVLIKDGMHEGGLLEKHVDEALSVIYKNKRFTPFEL